MHSYHLKEVAGDATKRLFHRVPFLIYENDEEFIPHLEADIENVFDKRLNSVLQNGDTRRWVLLDEDNVPTGRIAAFYYQAGNNKRYGGAGFFECVNNQEAAAVLFDAAEKFLKQNSVSSMEAPVNCGERDRFWGLLVEGFESPSYLQNYNPPYYQALFESDGYIKEFEQYYYAVNLETFPAQRFESIAQRVLRNKQFSVKHFEEDRAVPFVHHIADVFNQAWGDQEFFKPLTYAAVDDILDTLNVVIEPDLLWIAYDGNKPIGAFLALRELNELFADADGDLTWWDKIILSFRKKKVPITKVQSFMFGVIPEYRHKGIEALLIHSMFNALKKFTELEFMELAWIGNFNPGMLKLVNSLGAKKYKVLYTYNKKL